MRGLAKIPSVTVAVCAPVVAAVFTPAVLSWMKAFFLKKAPVVEAHLPALSRWVLANAGGIRMAMCVQALLVLALAFVILRRSKTEENQLASLLLLTSGSLVLVVAALAVCLLGWLLPFT